MLTKPFSVHWVFSVICLLLTCHYSLILAQDSLPLDSTYNRCGVNNHQGRYFISREARLAMGPAKALANGSSYMETLFFGSSNESGVQFVTKILRAGGLADASQRVLATKTILSAEELQTILLKMSVPNPKRGQWGDFPVVTQPVKVGTEWPNWPESARAESSEWIEPYRRWDDSTPVYDKELHVVIIYDEECKGPEMAGILKGINYSTISIWINSFDSIKLPLSELKRCEIFRLNGSFTDTMMITRTAVAKNLPAGVLGHVMSVTREDDLTRASHRDFDSFLKWASAEIGGSLLDKTIRETEKELESFYSRLSNSADIRYYKEAGDKYLLVLRSAKSSDMVVAPQLNGLPNTTATSTNEISGPQGGEDKTDRAEKLLKEIVKLNVEKATNSNDVKNWVDAKIAEGIDKNPNVPKSKKTIIASLEQALEQETKSIQRGAIVAKGLLVGLDVFSNPTDNEKALEEIRKFASNGDPYSAWKKTLSVSLGMSSDVAPGISSLFAATLQPVVSEVLAEATVDIYVPLGNRIAWLMWENGYSPNPPRFAKDQFEKGVKRPGGIAGPIPKPTVPAVPNGVPVPSSGNSTPTVPVNPPLVVPPSASGSETGPRTNQGADRADNFQVPFVPAITPVPLPPPIFNKPASNAPVPTPVPLPAPDNK